MSLRDRVRRAMVLYGVGEVNSLTHRRPWNARETAACGMVLSYE